jgi:hypothetical protein
MPPVKNVGKPCAGEPHARFDGRELETERTGYGHEEEQPDGKPLGSNGFVTYRRTRHRVSSRPSHCVILAWAVVMGAATA